MLIEPILFNAQIMRCMTQPYEAGGYEIVCLHYSGCNFHCGLPIFLGYFRHCHLFSIVKAK